jgi:hypothetical protein
MSSVFLKDKKWQKEFFYMAIKDFLEKKENNFIDYKYSVLEDIDDLLDYIIEKGEKQIWK